MTTMAVSGDESGGAGAKAASRLILGLCFVTALVEGFDIQSMGVAGPRMLPALGLTPSTAGLLFSASLLGMIPGALIGGSLSNRLTHRIVLAWAVAVFGVFTVLTPVFTDYGILIVVRVLAGLGLGAAMPSLIAIAAEQVSGPRRAAVVTAMTSGIPLGAAVAALVGRFTLEMDWRLIFVIGGLAPLLLAVAILRIVPRAAPQAITTPSATAQAESSDAPAGGGPLAANWRVLTMLLSGAYLFTLMALLLLMNWLPSLLASSGIALALVGILVMGFNIGGAVGGIALGRLIQRLGTLPVIGLIYGGLTVLLIVLGSTTASLPVLAGLLFATGFLLMGGQCVLYGLGASLYPDAVRAGGVGVAITAGRVGAALGPVIAGVLLAQAQGVGGVMIATAAILVLGGIAAFAAARWKAPAAGGVA